MGFELVMKEALASRPDAVALACMDTRSGFLLGLQVRGDVARDDVEIAAYSAVQLVSAPGTSDDLEGLDEDVDESFVASARWIHAFARVPNQRELVVVGLAPGDANVALLRAWIRQVAGSVGPEV
ncbi:MAG: hypothetical protein U0169_06790 [Polyangiaceae bacterium]